MIPSSHPSLSSVVNSLLSLLHLIPLFLSFFFYAVLLTSFLHLFLSNPIFSLCCLFISFLIRFHFLFHFFLSLLLPFICPSHFFSLLSLLHLIPHKLSFLYHFFISSSLLFHVIYFLLLNLLQSSFISSFSIIFFHAISFLSVVSSSSILHSFLF